MSSVSRVAQLERELAGLREKAAGERGQAAKKRGKAAQLRGQITRYTSRSQASQKEHDANKAEEASASHETKAAAYDRQAATKETSLDSARKQLTQSQERGEQQRSRDRKREQARELRELRKIEQARRKAHQHLPDFLPQPLTTFAAPRVDAPPAKAQAIYDVCLSFAGEQRSYVELVARELKVRGYNVFYDDDEKVKLWGSDLAEAFDRIYRLQSRACVMFISAEYAAKPWTRHERRSALARALEEDEYVLPARFDDTELPGLRPTVGYIDLAEYAPQSLVDLIAEKLGPPVNSEGGAT